MTTMRWTATRVARPVHDLGRSSAFYRDLLGLPSRGSFRAHDGYDGQFFALPGGGELELTAGPAEPRPGGDEDLLVLYVRGLDEVDAIASDLVAAATPSVQSANPYWTRFGRTFLDPDGYRVVIAAEDVTAAEPVDVAWHHGPRAELRKLFELAEDSASQLDQYIELGRVLVARRGPALVGHLQLMPTRRPGEIELRNMAVRPELQGTGVGRALVEAAFERCRAEGLSRMIVATATADVDNLRFYQRVGFRMVSIEPDAFRPSTGYPDRIMIHGIALRDRAWLSVVLEQQPRTRPRP